MDVEGDAEGEGDGEGEGDMESNDGGEAPSGVNVVPFDDDDAGAADTTSGDIIE
jgi:hypothetical protein